MEERMNQGYLIINSIMVGESEFVLGQHKEYPDKFVTWQCRNKTDYFWGHYTDNPIDATRDLCERTLSEIEYMEYRKAEAEKAKQRQGKSRER